MTGEAAALESAQTAEPAAPLGQVATWLADPDELIGAIASGRRRGAQPRWRRAELRYVDLKSGAHLQITTYDATQAHTSNHLAGPAADRAIADLMAEQFGNWQVTTRAGVHQVRFTKKGDALLHTRPLDAGPTAPADRGHDREKSRLLPADDPIFAALGIATHDGRIKPSRQAKYRQVEEFVRQLDAVLTEALTKGHLRTPTADDPLRLVDLGCGNAYLTFAAHRFLSEVRGLPVALTGVDTKAQSRRHNQDLSSQLHIPATFRADTISDVRLTPAPEVVLALHACDTATDDALARAIEWEAPVVLAAPCCHHDVAAQLRRTPAPAPYAALVRDGIVRERFADTVTDALRALLLRMQGYRVDIVEFVDSKHTPRNSLLRAVRAAGAEDSSAAADYADLTEAWGLRPRLGELLAGAGGR